jgi:hypothetical protein
MQAADHFNICLAELLQGHLCTLWTHLALFPAPFRDHLPQLPPSYPPFGPDRAAAGRPQPFYELLGTRTALGERPPARIFLASGRPSRPLVASAPVHVPAVPGPASIQPGLLTPWATATGAPPLATLCFLQSV